MSKLKDKTADMDAKIGARLAMARRMRGVSQEKLGEHLGITFQQVQKYEKGTNRISVGAALLSAEFLGVSAVWLMRGNEQDTGPAPEGLDPIALKAALIVDRLPPAGRRGALIALHAIEEAVSGNVTPEAEAA